MNSVRDYLLLTICKTKQDFVDLLFPFVEAVFVSALMSGTWHGCLSFLKRKGMTVDWVWEWWPTCLQILLEDADIGCFLFPSGLVYMLSKRKSPSLSQSLWTWEKEELLFDFLRRIDQSECSACCLFVLLPALWSVPESAPWMVERLQCCSAASS